MDGPKAVSDRTCSDSGGQAASGKQRGIVGDGRSCPGDADGLRCTRLGGRAMREWLQGGAGVYGHANWKV